MKLPVIHGLIDRRILVNYRVDPAVLAPLLPSPFRPKLIRGSAMVGICLIRLKHLRPRFFPSWLGVSSENAAHRAAVEWDEDGRKCEGVYVRRRDTNSRLNTLAGGRLFPGLHHHADFHIHETADCHEVAVQSDDEQTNLLVRGHPTSTLPTTSIFHSLEEASEFFQTGSIGYSPTRDPRRLEGLELRCPKWCIEPLAVDDVRSSYFENESLFPKGSIEFDCALLMRGIEHEWHEKPNLCCDFPSPKNFPQSRQVA